MRKSFVTLLLLMGGAALLTSPIIASASDDVGPGFYMMSPKVAKDGAHRIGGLGTATGGADPETIWVGYWSGANTANNWWKVGGVAGGDPAGGNRPGKNTDGLWTFDADQQVHGDSLCGFWTNREVHTHFLGTPTPDTLRPWWAVMWGNMANKGPQPGSGSTRTTGVIGVWHRDAGSAASQSIDVQNPSHPQLITQAAPHNPTWAPLGGGFSAWMGLRAHGDVTYKDAITNNPFNGDVVDQMVNPVASPGGDDRLLPGYISAMDQMLYRNVDMTGYTGGGVAISFKYQTNMSTGKADDDRFRTGWHEGDGLSLRAPTPENFISAEADNGSGANSDAPLDSFQVYIGSPVEGEWKTSLHPLDVDPALVALGAINPVTGRRVLQDPMRRWMNEVLEKDARLWLFGVAGDNAAQTVNLNVSDANVSALLDSAATTGQTNKLRLVFRVHTNQAFSDAGGSVSGAYTSGYAGAAVVDDVTIDIGTGVQNIGDFEAAGSIDNSLTTNPNGDNAWRSTGKPPAMYLHPEDSAGLVYEDICGGIGSPNRICDLQGVVINMGIHDRAEAATDPNPLSTDHEGYWGMVTPAVNLAGWNQDSKDPTKNNMNLSASERFPTDDFILWYEGYWGYFDVFGTGQIWSIGMQSYPAQQKDGVVTWGQCYIPGSLFFNPEKQCYQVAQKAFGRNLIKTSNVPNYPDSLRMYLRHVSQCYRFGVTTGCSPTDGGYFDDLSIGIVDGVPSLLSMDIWDIYNDTFPANENASLPGTAAFDTATAHIKSGLGIAPTTSNLQRYAVPGDSILGLATGDSIRVDLMFRILPGVGNYQTVGNRNSGLRDFGTGFWNSYKSNPGTFSGMPGAINPGAAIAAHLAAPSGWSELVWNSARMDTSQRHALFPVQNPDIGIGLTPAGDEWASTYHETELAARPSLGIPRNRCFPIDTTVSNTQDANINCGSKAPYPPAWVTTVPAIRTGWNGTTTTLEGTKILPDGLFTPGTAVQYFLRRQDFVNPTTNFAMCPDTGTVFPQSGESNFDGHRWQQFGVLPDRWKDQAFAQGGLGMAQMLFYDNNDRRGEELSWKAIADSIGATQLSDVGNADGYGYTPGTAAPVGTNLVNDPANFIANKNKQMGTMWDMYQMKASESLTTGWAHIGGRLGYRGVGQLMDDGMGNGKWTYNPPTPDMMNTYYKVLMWVTGDLNGDVWGPYTDVSPDDITFVQNWLQAGNTGAPDRGILVVGESFAEAADGQGDPQDAFVKAFLAQNFTDPNYLLFVPDGRTYVDIKTAGAEYISDGGVGNDIYGVNNSCVLTNDVVDVNAAVPNASVNLSYVLPDQSLLPVGVIKRHDSTNPWISQTINVQLASMRGRFGTTKGRLAWMYNTLLNVFGDIAPLVGNPVVTLDTPQTDNGSQFVNFMNLRNNPLTSGYATVNFGLAKDDFVQVKVFDVSGRLVRTLADRKFPAGEHSLVWDGVDNGGRQLARGVYFTQVRYRDSGFELAKKLTILR